jgi:hypothetical protein
MAHPPDVDANRIEETLSAFRDLQAHFDLLRDLLRRADAQKHTVSRRVYERVRAEYDRELDSIRARMSPLRDELETARASLESQIREAERVLESVEDELAEAGFRHRIGEFDEARYEAARRAIDERLSAARARHAGLRAPLAVLDAMKESDAHAATDAETLADAPLSDPESSEKPAAPEAADSGGARAPSRTAEGAPRRPVLRPTAAGADGFENPQDWIEELGRDATRRRPPSETAGPGAAPSRSSATAAVDTAPAQGAQTPSLVFVRGAHAGQSIALLHTTLTIGREHDNNVELKDPDVARYHARIIHERGDYVVEDLESSTGTWVNGQRTRRAVLRHGDVIRVGQTEIALDFEWASRPR